MQGKAEDEGGLTPAKDDNAAMRPLYPRAFARNSDDCYSYCITFFMKIQPEISLLPAKADTGWRFSRQPAPHMSAENDFPQKLVCPCQFWEAAQ